MMRRDPPLRVLVLEDDPEAAEEMAELLESHGVIAQVATSADQAEAMLAAFSPDMALVDLQLGPASGAVIAARWHSRAQAPHVVLLSGRDLTVEEQRLFGQSRPPLLRKPLDLASLVLLAKAAWL